MSAPLFIVNCHHSPTFSTRSGSFQIVMSNDAAKLVLFYVRVVRPILQGAAQSAGAVVPDRVFLRLFQNGVIREPTSEYISGVRSADKGALCNVERAVMS